MPDAIPHTGSAGDPAAPGGGPDGPGGRAGATAFGGGPAAPRGETPGGGHDAPDDRAGRPEPGAAAAPGLAEQLRATRDAVLRLVGAHVDLARAEFGDILGEVGRLAAAAGIALALLLFTLLLVPVGATLFIGEWLFGSIGWGVLLGAELSIAAAVAVVLGALGLPRPTILRWLLIAIVTGAVLGVLLGTNATNEAWRRLGDAVAPGLAPESRPLLTGALALAIVGAVVGLVRGLTRGAGAAPSEGARGGGAAAGGFVGGALLGLLIGAFSALTFRPGAGAALGVAVALVTWPVGLGLAVGRDGIDIDALKARLWPSETIRTTRETIEWVREQTPLGPKF